MLFYNEDVQDLPRTLLRHSSGPVTPTVIPGLTLYRSDRARSGSIPLFYKPMVCIMAQGEKRVLLGQRAFRYTPANYLLSSIELPVQGTVLHAAPGRPYLSASLELDPVLLSELASKMLLPRTKTGNVCGLAVGKLDGALLDAFARLLRLLDTPEDIELLAPCIKREIFYRLLRGEHGVMLHQLCAQFGSAAAPVAQAIRWIRDYFQQPFSAKALAARLHMSEASLNRHFRAVTAMSPLQYQKQVRLQEARRLLLSGDTDAATTAAKVGYASPSQFSREYARTFGNPPITDATRLRRMPDQPVA